MAVDRRSQGGRVSFFMYRYCVAGGEKLLAVTPVIQMAALRRGGGSSG